MDKGQAIAFAVLAFRRCQGESVEVFADTLKAMMEEIPEDNIQKVIPGFVGGDRDAG